jgi:hypothetical protein
VPDIRRNIDVVIRAKDELTTGTASSLGSMQKLALGAAAVSVAVAGIGYAVRQTVSDLSNLERRSRIFGITTEQIQRVDYATKIFGGDSEQLFRTLQRIEAKGKDLAGPLAVLGIRYDELRKRSPTDQILALSRGFDSIENHATRSRVAVQLFGEGGEAALALFGAKYEEVQKAINKAPLIDQETIDAATTFDRLLDSIIPKLKAWAINTLDISKEWKDFNAELGKTFAFNWSMLNPRVGAQIGRGGAGNATTPAAPFQLPGDLVYVPGLGVIPSVTSPAFANVNQDIYDRVRKQQAGIPKVGGQIGSGGLRSSTTGSPFGARRTLSDLGPVGMFPTSSDEERENKLLEDRVKVFEQWRDLTDAVNEGIAENQRMVHELGATLVDTAFSWSDAWGEGMGRVLTGQEKFADMAKRTFRQLVQSLIAEINRLIVRQWVAAVLSSFLGGGNPAGVIAAASAAAGAGVTGGGTGNSLQEAAPSAAFSVRRPTTVGAGDVGRTVVLNANIRTTFGSRSEMAAAATMLQRYAQEALA